MKAKLLPREVEVIRQVCLTAPRHSPWPERNALVIGDGVVAASDGYRASWANVDSLHGFGPLVVPGYDLRKTLDHSGDIVVVRHDQHTLVVWKIGADFPVVWPPSVPAQNWALNLIPFLRERADAVRRNPLTRTNTLGRGELRRWVREARAQSENGRIPWDFATVDGLLFDKCLAASRASRVTIYGHPDLPILIDAGEMQHLVEPIRLGVAAGRQEAA